MNTPIPAAPPGPEYVDGYLPDDEMLAAARARAEDLGCVPLAAGAGATLRFLATTRTNTRFAARTRAGSNAERSPSAVRAANDPMKGIVGMTT